MEVGVVGRAFCFELLQSLVQVYDFVREEHHHGNVIANVLFDVWTQYFNHDIFARIEPRLVNLRDAGACERRRRFPRL